MKNPEAQNLGGNSFTDNMEETPTVLHRPLDGNTRHPSGRNAPIDIDAETKVGQPDPKRDRPLWKTPKHPSSGTESETESQLNLGSVYEFDKSPRKEIFLNEVRKFLHGKYEIHKILGAGGMGVVMLAKSLNPQRWVALKLNFEEDEDAKIRTKKEARTTAALQHPNIVKIHDVEEISGSSMLVYEYIEGHNGKEAFVTSRPSNVPLSDSLGMALQLVEGIAAAHSMGILHRDIKPANTMIDQRGVLKVTDFGLGTIRGVGKKLYDSISHGLSITQEGDLLGTIPFLAPESFDGQYSKKTDIYALGLTLYEIFTGRTNALEFSKGVKKRDGLMGYLSKVSGCKKKTPSISKDDYNLQLLLGQDPGRVSQIIELLSRMTAFRRENRPTIEKVKACLKTIIEGGVYIWSPQESQRKKTRGQILPVIALGIGMSSILGYFAMSTSQKNDQMATVIKKETPTTPPAPKPIQPVIEEIEPPRDPEAERKEREILERQRLHKILVAKGDKFLKLKKRIGNFKFYEDHSVNYDDDIYRKRMIKDRTHNSLMKFLDAFQNFTSDRNKSRQENDKTILLLRKDTKSCERLAKAFFEGEEYLTAILEDSKDYETHPGSLADRNNTTVRNNIGRLWSTLGYTSQIEKERSSKETRRLKADLLEKGDDFVALNERTGKLRLKKEAIASKDFQTQILPAIQNTETYTSLLSFLLAGQKIIRGKESIPRLKNLQADKEACEEVSSMLVVAKDYLDQLMEESKKCATYEGSQGQKDLEQLGIFIATMQRCTPYK